MVERAAPAPPADVPSELTDDGWTRWDLPTLWLAPPDAPTPRPLGEGPPELLAAYVELPPGMPDARGGELHEVELPLRAVGGEDETIRGPRMVVTGSVHGVRFAIDRGVLVPVAAMGPELDLAQRFEAALALVEAREPTDEVCPLLQAWPAVLALGRRDLVDRYAALPMVAFEQQAMAGRRYHELARRALAHFHRSDDEAARRDLASRQLMEHTSFTDVHGTRAMAYRDETIAELARELTLRTVMFDTSTLEGEIAALADVTVPAEVTRAALAADPRVRAVVARGEAAVPALIEALEDDERTTRIVLVDEVLHPEAVLLRRSDAVYAALAQILDLDFHAPSAFGEWLTHQDARTIDTVRSAARAYWAEMGSISPIERRWRVLVDDDRTPLEWADAAIWLVEASARPRAFARFQPFSIAPASPMRGEPLRERTGPSVTELLLRRMTESTSDERAQFVIALAAARWDRAALAPHLDSLPRDSVMSLLPVLGEPGWPRLAEALRTRGGLVLFLSAGDFEAWVEYLHGALGDPSVAAALQGVLASDEEEGLIDARVPMAVALARRGFVPARDMLIAALHDPEIDGELWPGAEGRVLASSVTLILSERVTERRDVSRGELAAFFVGAQLSIPYSFAADPAAREARVAEMVAALGTAP